ncbi:Large-conductance mechanosensitive channel [Streptococcus thermophilus]|nr:Large-conductance mechanosensitive channel [Streptococcus thermophilus]CAD0150640.1 Large-conductance mechanosensitive channel [Streptococcus thermophilus]
MEGFIVKMIRKLRDFLFKGNVLDLAVAVVMGAAFNAIVTSLVSDIITPLILNPVVKAANVENLSKLSWNGIAYGSFLSAVINFIIVGTTLFFVVKAAGNATAHGQKQAEEAAEEAGPSQEELLAEIRDLLANK